MTESAANLISLLEAVSFAGRAHDKQKRKDGQTPYSCHVFRVCLILRHAFSIDNPAILTAAVLHDTIEDTNTDYDDLAARFGASVAEWVGLLSKDKRLPDADRERLYTERLAQAPWQVQVVKLADILDNVMDSRNLLPAARSAVFKRARFYLDALRCNLAEQAREPWEIVRKSLESQAAVPEHEDLSIVPTHAGS